MYKYICIYVQLSCVLKSMPEQPYNRHTCPVACPATQPNLNQQGKPRSRTSQHNHPTHTSHPSQFSQPISTALRKKSMFLPTYILDRSCYLQYQLQVVGHTFFITGDADFVTFFCFCGKRHLKSQVVFIPGKCSSQACACPNGRSVRSVR